MSLSEATQLVLQAGLMGGGGEVLVLDMGEPVRIVDLARDMIRLSGADPDAISIVFTGLRPGEKLYEEPLASEETPLATPHPKLYIAQARANGADGIDQMIAWLERDRAASDAEVRAWLKAWIPEYRPPADLAEPAAGAERASSPAAAERRRRGDSSYRAVPERGDRRDAPRRCRSRPCSADARTRAAGARSAAPRRSRA